MVGRSAVVMVICAVSDPVNPTKINDKMSKVRFIRQVVFGFCFSGKVRVEKKPCQSPFDVIF
jgi:hypothetical protein